MSSGIAVVTGSASGIGKCTAARLESQGFEVIGIDLHNATIEADLSTVEGRETAVGQALKKSGGTIDRLVVAAGLGGHLEDGGLVAKVNYYGAIEVLDGLKPALEKAGGRVVVVSSNSAQMGVDPDGPIVNALLDGTEDEAAELIGDAAAAGIYGQSKHALARAVRRRAAAWGEAGIRLNAIAPGQTETPLFRGAADHPQIGQMVSAIPIPMKRVAAADEMAAIMEFLLSDTAAYMHGSIVYADGGTDAMLRPDAF